MRYLIVLAAYIFVAFLVGLAFLFPNRPADLGGFTILMFTLVPVLAVFDLVGQTIIDSERVSTMGAAARPAIGLGALVLFLGAVYLVVKLVAPETVPW